MPWNDSRVRATNELPDRVGRRQAHNAIRTPRGNCCTRQVRLDASQAQTAGDLSVADSLRFNYRIQELKRVSRERRADLRKRCRKQVRAHYYRARLFWYAAAGFLSLLALFPLQWHAFAASGILLALACIVWEFGQERGYVAGFLDSYQSGFSAGIDKIAGIDRAKSRDDDDLAIQMEMDERALASSEIEDQPVAQITNGPADGDWTTREVSGDAPPPHVKARLLTAFRALCARLFSGELLRNLCDSLSAASKPAYWEHERAAVRQPEPMDAGDALRR